MRRVRDAVITAVREHGMWAHGDAVTVAASGGVDSMVLLHILVHTQGLHGGRLRVVTVDHGTRDGSAQDAQWVAEVSAEWGVPCRVVHAALGADASEATCRTARRAALTQEPAVAVVLAHHARDQVETLLIRLMRGTGPRGLPGMVPFRAPWARPMLGVSHADVLAYARDQAVPFREDPSNRSDRFLRNRVRHELLPLIDAIRPGSVSAMARTAELMGEESTWLDAEARAVDPGLPWPVAFLTDAPDPLVRRAVSMAEPGLGHRHIDALRSLAQRGTGQIQLPNGRVAIAEAGCVRTCPVQDSPSTGGACDT